MTSGAIEYNQIFGYLIDQKPIWFNVAFKFIYIFTNKFVGSVTSFEFFVGGKFSTIS
jgi:hypothetical protein